MKKNYDSSSVLEVQLATFGIKKWFGLGVCWFMSIVNVNVRYKVDNED